MNMHNVYKCIKYYSVKRFVAGAATISIIAWHDDSPVPECKMLSKVKIYDLGLQVQGGGGGGGEGCTLAYVDWGKKVVYRWKRIRSWRKKNAYFDLFEEVYHN